MEAFSLLKFWRPNPTDNNPSPAVDFDAADLPSDDAPIQLVESDSESDDDDSFFDLEFTVPGQEDSPKKDAADCSDFLDSPNNVFCHQSEPNSKPQSPISFLIRSPPKFNVLMFFKKPKLDSKTETTTTNPSSSSPSTPNRFVVKCDDVEFPVWSLLNRVNSSKSKSQKDETSEDDSSKRFGKGGGVQKYLKLIKPLYEGSPKSCGDEVGVPAAADPTSSPATLARSPSKRGGESKKQGSSRTASLRVVCKLGKSRSAAGGVVPASKSDDSLALQNDGIQGAILHCKKSFNSPRGDSSSRSRFGSETSSESEISGSCRNSSSEDEKERFSIGTNSVSSD